MRKWFLVSRLLKTGTVKSNYFGVAMLLKSDINKLMKELTQASIAMIEFGGSSITVKASDQSKISLSTPVYFGGNYIPKSVRACVKQTSPFQIYPIRTDLIIDEENFRIYLNYLGDLNALNNHHFIDVLEDFSSLAEKWREYLDEHDHNDLVYVTAH